MGNELGEDVLLKSRGRREVGFKEEVRVDLQSQYCYNMNLTLTPLKPQLELGSEYENRTPGSPKPWGQTLGFPTGWVVMNGASFV